MNTQLRIEIEKTGGLDKLRTVSSPLPSHNARQVLIKIQYAGVAFADILMREGLYPDVPRKQLTPGYDVVGEVVAVGDEVHDLQPGQRVVALTQTGGYAQFIAVDQMLVVPCPENLPAQEAVALVLNYTTAYQMLNRLARLQQGERVLVHGAAGGVGSALVELAHLQGAKVYGTISARKRRQWDTAKFIPVDYEKQPFLETLATLEPGGIDIVLDGIGGTHLKHSYKTLSAGGRVVSYGFSTSIRNGRRSLFSAFREIIVSLFSPIRLMSDNRAVMGYNIWTLARSKPEWFREDMAAVLKLWEDGKIRPLVGKVLPLAQAREAQRLMQTSEVAGKLVLACNEA